MNETLIKLQELEKGIKKIEKILKDKDYLAEGINLSFTVGKREDDHIDLELGIYSKMDEEFLKFILQGLKNTKDIYLRHAKEEFNELGKYLNLLK